MRVKQVYILLLFLLFASGCGLDESMREAEKWRLSLSEKDKKPYGTWLARQSLPYYFKGAVFTDYNSGFRLSNLSTSKGKYYTGRKLLVLHGLDFKISDEEWETLQRFIKEGNEVLLFCSRIDEKVSKDLDCYKSQGEEEDPMFKYIRVSNKGRVSLVSDTNTKYGYEGRSIKSVFYLDSNARAKAGHVPTLADTIFASIDSTNKQSTTENNDTSIPTENYQNSNADDSNGYDAESEPTYTIRDILGYSGDMPNFVRYTMGKGHLTIHAAPLVLSNYFLMQDNNVCYLTGIWQSLSDDITNIYWDSYYKRSGESSQPGVLWRFPATRLAVILAIFAMLMYILFEGKRKQREIPVIAALKNESVSFVETVGRLYFNKGNHNNLAEKMSTQFLEWVRLNYFINTNLLDENFIHQLTIKSGKPESTVRGLVEMITDVKKSATKIDDAYLYQLYNTIQLFYKK